MFAINAYEAQCIQPGGFEKKIVHLAKNKDEAERFFITNNYKLSSKISRNFDISLQLHTGYIKGNILFSFCRQLAGIRDATGLNIVDSLRIIQSELAPIIQYLLPIIIEQMEKNGLPFYMALQKVHFTKDESFYYAVKAGEESSTLSEVLRSYADINETIQESFKGTFKEIKKAITNIMFLPITLVLVATLGRWMAETTASNSNTPIPPIIEIILSIPAYSLIAFLVALGFFAYYISQNIVKQTKLRVNNQKPSFKDITENIQLTNVITKKFRTSKHNLSDLVSIRAMIQGRNTFLSMIQFLASRQNIYGLHKDAWKAASTNIMQGKKEQEIFEHPYFTKMFQSYLIRLNNSTELDRIKVIDEAIKSQIDDVKVATQKMQVTFENVGMICFILAVLLYVSGIYLPTFIQSGAALNK